MSGFYTEVAQAVREVLVEFGAPALLKQRTSVYNPATGVSAVTSVDVAVTAAVFDFERKFNDPTTILQGDKQVFLSVVAGMQPKPSDRFVWQGQEHSVINVKNLSPAGIMVLYELQVRL